MEKQTNLKFVFFQTIDLILPAFNEESSIRKGIEDFEALNLFNEIIAVDNSSTDNTAKEIKKTRDKSIILIGFGGGFRRTELVSIDHEDLEFVSEGVKITIKRSKTDQFGEGMI